MPCTRRYTRTGAPPSRSRPRTVVYGQDLQAPLVTVWAVLGGLCGKRMAPFMGEVVGTLERFGELRLTERQRDQLCTMSAATIDRRLAPERGA